MPHWQHSLASAALMLALIAACWVPSCQADWRFSSTSSCFEMGVFGHGLGSTLGNMLNFVTILRARWNYTRFIIDYSSSPYQCTKEHDPDGLWYFFDKPESYVAGQEPKPGSCDRKQRADALMPMLGDYYRELARKHGVSEDIHTGVTRCKMESRDNASLARRDALVQEFDSEHCKTVRDFWRFSPRVKAVVDYELFKLRQLPRPLVGVHVRGGDKLTNRVQGGQYRDFGLGLNRVKTDHPDVLKGTVFLVGDDHKLSLSVQHQVSALFGPNINLVNLVPPAQSGHEQSRFNSEPLAFRCPMTLSFLVDISLLAAADHHIGMVHSNVDALAALVGHCVHNRTLKAFVDAARECDTPFKVGA